MGKVTPTLKRVRAKLQTTNVAYTIAIIAIFCEGLVMFLMFLAWIKALTPDVISATPTYCVIGLGLAFVFTAILLFVAARIVVYIIRLFVSLFLVWTTLGFMFYLAHVAGVSEAQSIAFVTVVLFIVMSLIFYGSLWTQKRILGMILEHRESIERIEEFLGRVSKNIPKTDAEQLAKFVGKAKRSWSSLMHGMFAESSNAAIVFYKALIIALGFFGASWYLSTTVANASQYVGTVLVFLVLFTMFLASIDWLRLERLRTEMIHAL